MPDVHITRHGDRWALSDAPGEAPIFESYTREEAESEARRRAEGGRIHWSGDESGETAVGQDDPAAEATVRTTPGRTARPVRSARPSARSRARCGPAPIVGGR